MKLRSVRFRDVDLDAIVYALKEMGYQAIFVGNRDSVDNWIRTTNIIEKISDAISPALKDGTGTLVVGQAWDLLPEQDYDDVEAIAEQFEWESRTESDLRESVTLACRVAANEEHLGEILADPVMFAATMRFDRVSGPHAASILEALSIVRLVVSNNGEMVWNRYAQEFPVLFQDADVTWRGGKYFVKDSLWAGLRARIHSRSSRGKARVLGATGSGKESGESEPHDADSQVTWQGFPETEDVSIAALWLGMTVKEVRLNVLKCLLERERDLIEYVKVERVDLADIISLGGVTAVHSREGLVLICGGRTLVWPSLKEVSTTGYTFQCNWGLTRCMMLQAQSKTSYHYLRGHYRGKKGGWSYTTNETYHSRTAFSGRLLSFVQFAVSWIQVNIFRQARAEFNGNDALVRMRRTGEFVESAENTTAKPPVSPTMLLALSDPIDIAMPTRSLKARSSYGDIVENAWRMCFGDTIPKAEPLKEDELVVVLSYRHESTDVRMTLTQWIFCYPDLVQLARIHGKSAIRVWTDKLASNTRGDAKWIESGVEPYRCAVVLAFNGPGDSIFVDRFWLSLERNTAMRAWGYWLRDDLGQFLRLADNPYPANTDDRAFLSQILFTPGRADGSLWEEDRLAVIREAAQRLRVRDTDSLWDAMTYEFLPRRYMDFEVVDQERQAGSRHMRGCNWSPGLDLLVDRELLEKALCVELKDCSSFQVSRWMLEESSPKRFAAAKSKVSDHWFCAEVDIAELDGRFHVEDISERCLLSTEELSEITEGLQGCDELWDHD